MLSPTRPVSALSLLCWDSRKTHQEEAGLYCYKTRLENETELWNAAVHKLQELKKYSETQCPWVWDGQCGLLRKIFKIALLCAERVILLGVLVPSCLALEMLSKSLSVQGSKLYEGPPLSREGSLIQCFQLQTYGEM